MRRFTAFLCMSLATYIAHADLVATNGAGDELRLMETPCTNSAILDHIRPEYHAQFKRGQAFVDKKTLPLCWIDTGEGVYFVAFENGQALPFPITAFISSPGA